MNNGAAQPPSIPQTAEKIKPEINYFFCLKSVFIFHIIRGEKHKQNERIVYADNKTDDVDDLASINRGENQRGIREESTVKVSHA